MHTKIFTGIVTLLWTLAIIFLPKASAAGVWRLDGANSTELPRNFRILPELKISASAQPSLKNLPLLYETLRDAANSDVKIYIVDLRQEPHGFANGNPVSWYVEKNRANFYRGNDDIEGDELERLNEIIGREIEFVPLGKFDAAHFEPIKITVENISSERQAAMAAGFEYVRFGATDMIFPAPDVVDDFINFLAAIDKDDWLHFHCHAGHGRTTTFLVFCEILTNPDETLEEICERQYNLGGTNLLKKSDGGDWYAQAHNDRADKIRLFYRYAHENFGGMTWSEFLLKETD